ncbi:MAG TPA: 30S ribosomal protein S3 [Planctomycetota bacterium]|nr:30S ribosomal protein S3 [Planctomycetota bacterium]
MGQKCNPLGFRIGISERWRSRWNAAKKDVPRTLKEDHTIRRYLKKNYFFAGIPMIEIERTGENVTIVVHTARPGVLIGKKGKKLEEIQAEVEKLIQDKSRKVRLTISEVNRPELNSQLVAESVREQLEKRQAFRRVLKKTIQSTSNAGAQGVKVMVSGRLGGSEMSRCEHQGTGRLPLQDLSANIAYGFTEAKTPTGHIGIKVWIYLGPYGDRKPGAPTGPRRPAPREMRPAETAE